MNDVLEVLVWFFLPMIMAAGVLVFVWLLNRTLDSE